MEYYPKKSLPPLRRLPLAAKVGAGRQRGSGRDSYYSATSYYNYYYPGYSGTIGSWNDNSHGARHRLSMDQGSCLVVNHVTYHSKHGNLIVEYPGTEPDRVRSFIDCHMDVVTANPKDWFLVKITLWPLSKWKRYRGS